LAIGEKGVMDPLVYVLDVPALTIHRVIRNGALKSVAALSFNSTGDRLASVGGDPDYTLTIWDWKSEKTILRSKAFAQV
jgi:WD40 repeat protein